VYQLEHLLTLATIRQAQVGERTGAFKELSKSCQWIDVIALSYTYYTPYIILRCSICTHHATLLTFCFFVILYSYTSFIVVFTVLLNIITSSAILYRLKLVNDNDAFSDEIKEELQSLTLAQGISLEVVAIMNYFHYLGLREGGQVKLVHQAYWFASMLIQIWICFTIMDQISLLHVQGGHTFHM